MNRELYVLRTFVILMIIAIIVLLSFINRDSDKCHKNPETPTQMTNEEIIAAVKQCNSAGLEAESLHLTNDAYTIRVQCTTNKFQIQTNE